MKKQAETSPWKFASVGGTVRVNIQSGEDIRNLPNLDRKMWTVLSCPVQGLEFDAKTLQLIDVNADGKIRVDDVIATAQWLTRVVKDPDELLKESDSLPFDSFNTEDPDGARLQSSARQILKNRWLRAVPVFPRLDFPASLCPLPPRQEKTLQTPSPVFLHRQ